MAREDFTIQQGTTFSKIFTILDANNDPVDVSGHTAAAQFSKNYTSSNSTAFTTATNANGEITLSLTSNQTADAVALRYVYDIELTDPGGNVARISEGKLTISPEVTK